MSDPVQVTPFWFVIPLRGKAASKDWDRVCALLRATVRSVLNQRDPNFGIMIACQDYPDLGDINDPRIEILQGVFPPPRSLLEQALDKRAKKRLAAIEIRRRGGGYIMLLDSDDFVSRAVVEYARATAHPDGYYITDGYEYFAQDGIVRPLTDFYRLCGSCYIVNYSPEALPASEDAEETAFDAFKNHRLVLETAAELGLKLTAIPFPAAIYLRENGENHSVQVQTQKTRRVSRSKMKRMIDRLLRRAGVGPKITQEIAQEFGIAF